jgi:hypothetical protein
MSVCCWQHFDGHSLWHAGGMVLNVLWTEYQIREAWYWYDSRGLIKGNKRQEDLRLV